MRRSCWDSAAAGRCWSSKRADTVSGPDLDQISARTIGHYDLHAERYRDGTLDHDVAQNIDALLAAIEGTAPFEILDFGCGPGRDLKSFVARGHRATGLDGAARFCAMAREYSGCEVWLQDFLALDLPPARFDGVFANATLFHVPTLALPAVLAALHASLKLRGVLFCSNPRGANQEGYNGLRWGAYRDLEHWRAFMQDAGFEEVSHYYRPPGLPCDQQPWLASVWRRVGD
jgi:SAM-dependent methyltransferase